MVKHAYTDFEYLSALQRYANIQAAENIELVKWINLIAAAPDMLAACKLTSKAIENADHNDFGAVDTLHVFSCLRVLNEAVAKAEGAE